MKIASSAKSCLLGALAGLMLCSRGLSQDSIAIVDFNLSMVSTPGEVLTSMVVVMGLPELDIKERIILGKSVGISFPSKQTLWITGSPVQTSDDKPQYDSPKQRFICYKLPEVKRITDFTLDHFVPSLPPWFFGRGGGGYNVLKGGLYLMVAKGEENQEVLAVMAVSVKPEQKPLELFKLSKSDSFKSDIHHLKNGLVLLQVINQVPDQLTNLKILSAKRADGLDNVLLQETIRRVAENPFPLNHYYVLVDKGDYEEDPAVILKIDVAENGKISVQKKEAPASFDKFNVGKLLTIGKDSILIGNGQKRRINSIALYNFETNQIFQKIDFKNDVTNFTVTSDLKYLVAVSKAKPQVQLYDLKTGDLVKTAEEVAPNPTLVLSN
jgi:hypothetical protein